MHSWWFPNYHKICIFNLFSIKSTYVTIGLHFGLKRQTDVGCYIGKLKGIIICSECYSVTQSFSPPFRIRLNSTRS